MRILCVIDSLGSGGAQRQLVNLAIAFKERGHQVRFAVYHQENFFKGLLDEQHIKVDVICEPSYVKRLFKFRKYIRKGNFDAVLSFLEAANFICEFAGLPWKRWTLVVGERSANPNILKSRKLKFFRWFHIFADYIVSNSYSNLEIIRKINPLLPYRKCKVIYNMVDFDLCEGETQYVPLKNGRLNLVVAASHQYLKNAKGLVEAVDKLTKEEKGRLLINWYGDPSGDTSFKEVTQIILKCELQEVFNFHKAINNINEKFRLADVIGLFSFYEGLPNVVCEGMVLGKPVIASSVSDLNTLLSDPKCIFDPYNTEDICRAIRYVMSIPTVALLSIGNANRVKAYSLFEKNKIVSSYISLF